MLFRSLTGELEIMPTHMTLQLVDRSVTRPYGVIEDVLVPLILQICRLGHAHFSFPLFIYSMVIFSFPSLFVISLVFVGIQYLNTCYIYRYVSYNEII